MMQVQASVKNLFIWVIVINNNNDLLINTYHWVLTSLVNIFSGFANADVIFKQMDTMIQDFSVFSWKSILGYRA